MLMTSSLSQSVPCRQAIRRRVISMLLPLWCTSTSPGSPGASAFLACAGRTAASVSYTCQTLPVAKQYPESAAAA